MKSFTSVFTPRIKVVLAILFVCSMTFPIAGCFQYPEGPIFTLTPRTERIDGNWAVTEVKDANGVSVLNNFRTDTTIIKIDSMVVTDTITHTDSTVYDTTFSYTNVYAYKNQTMTVVHGRGGSTNNSVFIYSNSLPWSDGIWDLTQKSNYWIITFLHLYGKSKTIQLFYTVRKLTDNEFIYIDENNFEWQWKKL